MGQPSVSGVTPEGLAQLNAHADKLLHIRAQIEELEETEVREGELNPESVVRLCLAYLAAGEPRAVVHLLRRIPVNKDKDQAAEHAALGAAASAVLAGDWGAAQGSLSGRSWGDRAQEADDAAECLRIACLRLVGNAYSTIRLPVLAKMLGLSPEQTVSSVGRVGWSPVGGGGEGGQAMVRVGTLPPPPSPPGPHSAQRLSTLTTYASFLET